MLSRYLSGLLGLLLWWSCSGYAQTTTRIQCKTETAAVILKEDGCQFSLVYLNPTDNHDFARVELALLTPEGKFQTLVPDENVYFDPGIGRMSVMLPNWQSQQGTTWAKAEAQRVRYRIRVSGAEPAIEGECPVTLESPAPFEMLTASPRLVLRGTELSLAVQVRQRQTGKPLGGVPVEAVLPFESGSENKPAIDRLTVQNVTAADGFVTLRMPLQAAIDYGKEIGLSAVWNGHRQQQFVTFEFASFAVTIIETDQPRYRPGQIMRIRARLVDPQGQPVAGESVRLEIQAPDYATVGMDLTTSAHGHITFDWPIPEQAAAGNYRIEVSTRRFHNDSYERRRQTATVKVGRYKLPGCVVTATPDRPWYLKTDSVAQIRVEARGFAGKPLAEAPVHIVWKPQQDRFLWSASPVLLRGRTDRNGVCIIPVDLQIGLNLDHSTDLESGLRAEVTDPDTGKTGSCPFSLRVVSEPIQIRVYSNTHDHELKETPGLPLEVFISTTLPDGTPVPTTVRVSQTTDLEKKYSTSLDSQATIETNLLKVQTGPLGLARVVIPPYHYPEERNWGEQKLQFRAVDQQGRTGTLARSVYRRQAPFLQLQTSQTLYHQGEPLQVTLRTSHIGGTAVLGLSRNGAAFFTQVVPLNRLVQTVSIPFSPEYAGEIMVSATMFGRPEVVEDWTTVLFPVSQPVALPDAPLTARPDNLPTEELEVEKAVTPKTEGLEGRVNIWYSLPEVPLASVSNLTPQVLVKWVQTRRKFSSTEQHAATVLLRHNATHTNWDLSWTPDQNPQDPIQWNDFQDITNQLETEAASGSKLPRSLAELERLVPVRHLRDPWGRPYRFFFEKPFGQVAIEARSAGMDGQLFTADDIQVLQFPENPFRPVGEKIVAALDAFHNRTGHWIAAERELKQELHTLGISFEALRDDWGQPLRLEFRFQGEEPKFVVTVRSSGPNRRFESAATPVSDDVVVWAERIASANDFCQELRFQTENFHRKHGRNPRTKAELDAFLKNAEVEPAKLTDPWGVPLVGVFRDGTEEKKTFATVTDPKTSETVIHPAIWLNHQVNKLGPQSSVLSPQEKSSALGPRLNRLASRWFSVAFVSCGPDHRPGTADDVVLEEMREEIWLGPLTATELIPSGLSGPEKTGSVRGRVRNESGQPITKGDAFCLNMRGQKLYPHGSIQPDGSFLIEGVLPAVYVMTFRVAGHWETWLYEVPVAGGCVTEITLILPANPVKAGN